MVIVHVEMDFYEEPNLKLQFFPKGQNLPKLIVKTKIWER